MHTRNTLSHKLHIHSNWKISLGFSKSSGTLPSHKMLPPGKGRTNKPTTVRTLYVLASKYIRIAIKISRKN